MSYFSQQIDVLTRKYQEAVKASERKLKNTVERMVSREQFEAVLEESRMSREQSEKLRKELEKALRNGERLRL